MPSCFYRDIEFHLHLYFLVVDFLPTYIFTQPVPWAGMAKGQVFNQLIGLIGKVFANGPGDQGSIPGRIIPKTLKMILDTSLLNTQQYKVHIEGKVEQSRERSIPHPYTSV